ncbi:MAG: hypothetical protein IT555_17405 [Acetobacteraceae bacterium]|nr:hypothetical protein [Acetobacteraceae bacterium]
MRKVWYRFTSVSPQPPPDTSFAQPTQPSPVNTAVQRLRTDGRYIRFWNFARRTALPGLAAGGTLYLAWALLSVSIMSARESWGCVCRADPRSFTETLPVSSDFAPGQLCAATRVHLREGARYEIEVAIPAAHAWLDGGPPPDGLEASPNGLINGPSAMMTVMAPFRRHWRQPWFKLMARVGEQGADVYAPDWRLVSSDQVYVYRAKITANGTGPLFLYVNDGVPLGLTGWIYGNNHGTARITVRQISMEHHDVPAR